MSSASPQARTGVAIVTGASSGIGAELSMQLAARGQSVLAVARRADRLEQLSVLAREGGHAAVHPLAVDVTSSDGALRVRDRARELGGASWLINNAGLTTFGPFTDFAAADHVRQVRVNCEAVVVMTAAVLPDLIARGAGRLLNVASIAGFQPTPFMAVYGATKAFVLSWSEALVEELRGTGVTVTALCPGPVETEFFEAGGAADVPRRKVAGELSAAACARAGLDGAERGRALVIPGAMNKLKTLAAKVGPRAAVRRTTGKVGLGFIGLPRTGRKA